MTTTTTTGKHGASTWVTEGATHAAPDVTGTHNMLKPQGSRIVDAKRAPSCPTCHRPGVVVTLIRADGKCVTAWTHDDGSFVEWTGESNG